MIEDERSADAQTGSPLEGRVERRAKLRPVFSPQPKPGRTSGAGVDSDLFELARDPVPAWLCVESTESPDKLAAKTRPGAAATLRTAALEKK